MSFCVKKCVDLVMTVEDCAENLSRLKGLWKRDVVQKKCDREHVDLMRLLMNVVSLTWLLAISASGTISTRRLLTKIQQYIWP